jgi:hypothetical protein
MIRNAEFGKKPRCYSQHLRKGTEEIRQLSRYSDWLGLDDRSSRVRFPAGVGNFSLHHCVQNGSGVHPPSYPTGTGSSFPGGKAAGV